MSQNYSDYKLDRPNVHDMLPVVHQNPLVKALSETTFNRFYTKPELNRVIGTIGRRKSSTLDDQISESSTYDQAFQLQPAIKNTAATVAQITTYKDVKRMCDQLGIDTDRVAEWQRARQYNYALPVDLNKLLNYSEYYWTGSGLPEYVVIANPHLKLQAKLSQVISHYPTSDDKAATWQHIVDLLDLVNAYVPADSRLPITNFAGVVNDPAHAPYVQSTVPMDDKYTIKNDWMAQNKWVHRLDVDDLSVVQQAKMPIIEYNDGVQLTQYTYSAQTWMYRRNSAFAWETNTVGPSRAELFDRHVIISSSRDNDTVTFVGSTTLGIGDQLVIEQSITYDGKYTITNKSYDASTNQTTLRLDVNITTDIASGVIVPFTKTSHGDEWKGISTHWMLVDVASPVPTTAPVISTLTAANEQFVATQGQFTFVLASHTLLGNNVARVYVNGRRQYGTYQESSAFSIVFHDGLEAGDIVQIFPYAVAEEDEGKETVMIRVSEDDDAPLAPRCLVKYRKQEQYKTSRNQYPLFDMVDAEGKSLYQSATILSFKEDPTASVFTDFGARIARDALTKDFTFDISLVRDDGSLRFYLDNGVSSIWAQGPDYVPSLVDSDRQPVPDGTVNAVYEIPHQLNNNVHHECRGSLKYSELFLHFKSIIDSQPSVSAAVYGTNLTPSNSYRLKDSINYGLGGTIKDHSYSFDSFVSSLISSNYNVPSVLRFAEQQYNELLVRARERIEQGIVAALQSTDFVALGDLPSYLETKTLSALRNDTNLSRIYGDSTASIQSGVTNWISTLPYLRLANVVTPKLLRDDKRGILALTHHDGHTVATELNDTTNDATRTGIIRQMNLPTTKPTGDYAPGMMWYDAVQDKIYRLNIAAINGIRPAANLYPQGSYFFNSSTGDMFVNGFTGWSEVPETVEDRWSEFDLIDVVTRVLLKLETRLASNVKSQSLWTDKLPAVPTSALLPYLQHEFEEYCKSSQITEPYGGDYNAADAFTWNYSSALVGAARWEDINARLFGTSYPHLEPWCIQGFAVKPTWWDSHYDGSNEGRRWKSVMWSNIRAGVLPNSTNTVPAVAKVSVNTTAHTTADGYGPDDLLPPYWVPAVLADDLSGISDNALMTVPPAVVEISNNVYPFGTNGPKEMMWRNSVSFKYAMLRSMFLYNPIQFAHYTFGEELVDVNGLEVSKRTSKVLSHRDVVFHGDTDANGATQYFDGMNQLYVNFFRYSALDLNGSEFKRAWTTWDTQLSYAVGSFIANNTLAIDGDKTQIEITPNDYTVEVKTAHHVRDVWVDALYVTIAQSGSQREIPLGAGRDWKFSVNTRCPVVRDVSYYGVKKYRIVADNITNTFTMLDGSLAAAGWTAGNAIVFDMGINGVLPSAIDDMTYYFIIPVTSTTFKIASTPSDALIGHPVSLNTVGSGVIYVAELVSTFYALSGKNTPTLWKHFAINKSDVRTFNAALTLTGIQNIIDVVDGYSQYLTDQGIIFNDSTVLEYDAQNNRLMNWQYEVEYLIDLMYMAASNFSATNSFAHDLGVMEINPFRNNLWITHPTGILSEFNSLDVKDMSAKAVVYDSTGTRIETRNYHTLRQDKITHIAVVNQVFDSVQTVDFPSTAQNSFSFGGVHAYFDEYEHVIMFNPYTISNDLVYDSFLGISVPRLHVYFEKQAESTKRPNIGGFVIKDGKQVQNYEYTASNMLQYYDTFTANENSDFVNYGRRLLGYTPNEDYMTSTNVTPKSQFLFYKGMIKAKGTTGSVKAFTNTKHFSTADIDEFWAYRAFDFGDSRTNITYVMNLVPEDTVRSHAKFDFVSTTSDVSAPYFTKVALTDTNRWPDFPKQSDALSETNALFGTKVTSDAAGIIIPTTTTIFGTTTTRRLVYHRAADGVIVYKPLDSTRSRFVGSPVSDGSIIVTGQSFIPNAGANVVYVNGALKAYGTDYTEPAGNVVKLMGMISASDVVVIVPKTATLVEGVHYRRYNSRTIELIDNAINSLRITTFAADYQTISPVHIYDEKSQTVVKEIPAWDPAEGIHQSELAMYVSTKSTTDPARYNAGASLDQQDSTKFWGPTEVGKVWMDTTSFSYLNYKDLTQAVNNQLMNWGKVEEWSDPAIYQWVESTIAPKNWTNGTPMQEVYSRSRKVFTATVVGNTWTTPSVHGMTAGTEVVLNTNDTMPAPLKPATVYTLATASGTQFTLADRSGTPITLTDGGSGTFTVSPASFTSDWTIVNRIVEHYEAVQINTSTNTLRTGLAQGDEFSLFMNGVFVQDGPVLANGVIAIDPESLVTIGIDMRSRLTVIRKTGVIDGISSTRPANLDLSEASVQTYIDYPCSKVDHVSDIGITRQPLYYFWVRGSDIPVDPAGAITTGMLETLITNNNDAYMTARNIVRTGNELRMSQLVLAGISGTVSDPNRYTLRMRNNATLRNELVDNKGSVLKTTHSEWIMFREKQNQHIARHLWDMVTESVVGFSLADSSVPVPSLDRQVYDTVNGTSTRFGIGKGQAFVSGDTALESILLVLNSPEIDFDPIDIDYFLQIHDTTSASGKLQFMNDIYDSFPAKHVNRLFFVVMMDALANINVDYSGSLMKTSAISINGTTPLNVNGEFDE